MAVNAHLPQENPTQISPNSSFLHLHDDVNLSLTHGSPQPRSVTRSICFVQWIQKKKKFQISNFKFRTLKKKMQKTSRVHSSHIYFPLHAFYFVCNVLRKNKIQISKFKIRKFKKQKERKRKLALTSKKKEKKNILGI